MSRPVSDRFGDSPARERFAALLDRAEIPLAEAALAIAEEEYPGLRARGYLDLLDELARDVRSAAQGLGAAAILRALRRVLFEERGFRGNAEAYYDPRNSFLNEVLDRRLGIPLTLAIVYLEVGARVGLRVQGVAFPGHFLVKYASGGREIFVDAFNGGELLSTEDCAARFRDASGGQKLDPRALESVGTRQILSRMLQNLKRIFLETGDDVRTLWVVDRLLMLAPEDPGARRDRGLVFARLGGVGAAAADLEAYLSAAPGAEDAGELRALLGQLRAGARLLN